MLEIDIRQYGEQPHQAERDRIAEHPIHLAAVAPCKTCSISKCGVRLYHTLCYYRLCDSGPATSGPATSGPTTVAAQGLLRDSNALAVFFPASPACSCRAMRPLPPQHQASSPSPPALFTLARTKEPRLLVLFDDAGAAVPSQGGTNFAGLATATRANLHHIEQASATAEVPLRQHEGLDLLQHARARPL